MDRQIITIPSGFLRFQTSDWDIDWREQSTGMSVAGRRKIQIGRLPRWIGSPNLVFHPDRIPGWRAKRWAGRGQTGLFRLPMVDYVSLRAGVPSGATFSDGSTFSDSTTFAGHHTVRCIGGAPVGATEVQVDLSTATADIVPGQILSHDDWPFAVVAIIGNRLQIEMPLRNAIPAQDLILLQGRGIFEMTEPGTGNPAYDTSLTARPAFGLQEWLR